MFYNCKSLSSLNFSNLNNQNLVSNEDMFYNCSSLRYLDISGFAIEFQTSILDLLSNNSQIKINNKYNQSMNILFDEIQACNITMIYK